MKLSELIHDLQGALRAHGDMEAVIYDSENDE